MGQGRENGFCSAYSVCYKVGNRTCGTRKFLRPHVTSCAQSIGAVSSRLREITEHHWLSHLDLWLGVWSVWWDRLTPPSALSNTPPSLAVIHPVNTLPPVDCDSALLLPNKSHFNCGKIAPHVQSGLEMGARVDSTRMKTIIFNGTIIQTP